MGIEIGVILAFIAMIGWGFGDFFIQKATRKYIIWQPLFFITFFGTIILLPFVYKDLPALIVDPKIWVLILASVILFFGAVLDFEALKKGKLGIIEPIWSLEIPTSALLAFLLIGEEISLGQIILIIFLMMGLVLVSIKKLKFSKKLFLEKGVILAIIAAILMGSADFFIGVGARETNSLMVNFVLNIILAVSSFVMIVYNGKTKEIVKNLKKDKLLWLGMCIFDNAAWIAVAYAMVLAPIGIAIALSDSYIIIAVLLGMFVNKERLKRHQIIGLVIAIISAIVLGVITS